MRQVLTCPRNVAGRHLRHFSRVAPCAPIAPVASILALRRSSKVCIAIALLGVVLASPGVVAAPGGLKGKVVVSDSEFGMGFSSDAALLAAVRKQGKSTLKSDNGAWTLNLMVFLKEPAGAPSLNIVYYDVSVKPRDQVNFSEVQVQPTQMIVQVNGVAISKDLGFVKGHKYEVLATRLIHGKEKVYARGAVTLK
jgi:hypothetical protein